VVRQKSKVKQPPQIVPRQAAPARTPHPLVEGPAVREPVLLASAPLSPPAIPSADHPAPGPEFDRQVVDYPTEEAPGTVVVDTKQKFLYYVMEGGQAVRYGVSVGKEGFGWTGTVNVGNLQEWPKWFPPAEMVERTREISASRHVRWRGKPTRRPGNLPLRR
jgi:lipoprotein-anchoring transpeptidase ErfK/SrfK